MPSTQSSLSSLIRLAGKVKAVLFKGSVVTPLTKAEIKSQLRTDKPVIFEIGAADGLDTLEFIETFNDLDFSLYCFEPDPRNIASFKKNVKDKRVKLFEIAIGDTDGKVTFNQSSTIYSSSIKKPNLPKLNATWPDIEFKETLTVDSMTIDSFLKKYNIPMVDFIWADVQGAEDLMLKGAKNSLIDKIRYIYTEYSKVEYYEKEPNLRDILDLLGKNWQVVKDYKTDVLVKNTNLISE